MIRFEIPMRAPSAANLREHWAARMRRVKAQRNKARLLCPRWTAGPLLRVTLTRVAPRPLDSDNLSSALKAIRDGIASRLGVDDGSPLVTWSYAQEACRAGEEHIRVEVTPSSG